MLDKTKLMMFCGALAVLAACADPQSKIATPVTRTAAASAAPQPSQPNIAPVKPAARAQGPMRHIWGVVLAVDPTATTLTIQGKDGVRHNYTLSSDVQVDKGGDKIMIMASAIKVGDRVTVGHAGDVATTVHVNILAASGTVVKGN